MLKEKRGCRNCLRALVVGYRDTAGPFRVVHFSQDIASRWQVGHLSFVQGLQRQTDFAKLSARFALSVLFKQLQRKILRSTLVINGQEKFLGSRPAQTQ